jgi:hypothetical protein
MRHASCAATNYDIRGRLPMALGRKTGPKGIHKLECAVNLILEDTEDQAMAETLTVWADKNGCSISPSDTTGGLVLAGTYFGRLVRHAGQRWPRLSVRLTVATTTENLEMLPSGLRATTQPGSKDSFVDFTDPRQLRDWLRTEEGQEVDRDSATNWRLYIGK